MVSLTIELPDERAAALKELANERHISLEQLVQAILMGSLDEPGEAFEQEIEGLLEKHHELLQRLA